MPSNGLVTLDFILLSSDVSIQLTRSVFIRLRLIRILNCEKVFRNTHFFNDIKPSIYTYVSKALNKHHSSTCTHRTSRPLYVVFDWDFYRKTLLTLFLDTKHIRISSMAVRILPLFLLHLIDFFLNKCFVMQIVINLISVREIS